MKKAIALVLVLISVLTVFTACTSQTTSVEEDINFLTFSKEDADWQADIKTNEGVSFNCSSNYVMSGNAVSGLSRSIPIAVFMYDRDYFEENYGSDQFDADFQLSSNSKIVGIQYLDYEKQIIATKKVSVKAVIIPQHYQDIYVDEVVIFVEKDGKTYQAIFARTGA